MSVLVSAGRRVLEEHLPAGATVVPGSIRSQAGHVEQGDGVLTFYSFFRYTPRAGHVIMSCEGTGCYVRGAAGVGADGA